METLVVYRSEIADCSSSTRNTGEWPPVLSVFSLRPLQGNTVVSSTNEQFVSSLFFPISRAQATFFPFIMFT